MKKNKIKLSEEDIKKLKDAYYKTKFTSKIVGYSVAIILVIVLGIMFISFVLGVLALAKLVISWGWAVLF